MSPCAHAPIGVIDRTELYHYQPMSEYGDFRLLVIEPGGLNDEISCTLFHTAFQRKPQYRALSYPWGNNNMTHSVRIRNEVLPVTANLHMALKRFRLPDQQLTLWIDAICINQQNEREREQQVQVMRQIYSNAESVIIWLGDAFANIEEAFNFIHRFEVRQTGTQETQSNMDDPEVISSLKTFSDKNTALWVAIRSLSDRQWFMRTWVVQEAVVASQAQVVCGNQTCSWEALSKMVTWMQEKGFMVWLSGYSHRTIGMINVIKNEMRAENGTLSWPVAALANFFRYLKATDPRDKIFAFLGLTLVNGGIKPDYSMSCEELYTKAAILMLEEDPFFILSCAEYSAQGSEPSLPSWVPNWIGKYKYKATALFSFNHGFMTGGRTSKRVIYSESGQTLTVTGFVFDIVSRVSQHLCDEVTSHTNSREDVYKKFFDKRMLFQEFDEIANDSNPYPGEMNFEDALSRLFVCDQPLKGCEGLHPSDQLHKQAYRAMRYFLRHLEDFYARDTAAIDVQELANEPLVNAYLRLSSQNISYKRLCASSRRYLGWLPDAGALGDVICIFSGADVPYLLRPDRDDHYKLIGECYIQGIMHGEALINGKLVEQFNIL